MTYEFKTERRVEFAETDMAGILHFSNYFRYMEAAEHAFFRSLGLRVHANDESGVWGWARGHAECTFKRPLRNEEVVELHVLVCEKRERSISYTVVFRKVDGGRGEEVARGSMTTVCVAREPGSEEICAIPIPREVDAAIEPAPEELLRDT